MIRAPLGIPGFARRSRPGGAMLVREYEAGGVSVLQISGRLDAATVVEVDGRLVAASALNRPLVIDLAELTYISSVGLRILLQAAKRAQSAKLAFALAAPQPPVRDVFRITGLDSLLRIHDDVADALGEPK